MIEAYRHGMNEDLVCKKDEIDCSNIIKPYKMFNFDYIAKEDIKEHNPNWKQILDHPSGILIAGGSGSAKGKSLLNLTNYDPDIDKKKFICQKSLWKKISITN